MYKRQGLGPMTMATRCKMSDRAGQPQAVAEASSDTDTSKPAGPRPLILYSQERRSREQQSQYPKERSERESGVI